jgi:hypothetical protein
MGPSKPLLLGAVSHHPHQQVDKCYGAGCVHSIEKYDTEVNYKVNPPA